MFHRGEIVLAPCPSADGSSNLPPQYLIVMDAIDRAVLCMLISSNQEAVEGTHPFTDEEQKAARFSRPACFHPGRLVLYPPSISQTLLRKTGGKLTAAMLSRLGRAATKVKARFQQYRHAA